MNPAMNIQAARGHNLSKSCRDKIGLPLFVGVWLALTSSFPAHASPEPYDLGNEVFVSSVLWQTNISDLPGNGVNFLTYPWNTPIATFNENTYVVYVDPELRPMVARITAAGNVEAWPLDPNPDYTSLGDGHHAFSIGIDEHGYIHVSGDMHNYPDQATSHLPPRYRNGRCLYWRSVNPEDISAFTWHGDAGAPAGYGFTYSAFANDMQGRLFYYGRTMTRPNFGQRGFSVSRYIAATGNWSMIGGLNGVDPIPCTAWEDNGENGSTYQFIRGWVAFDRNNGMYIVVPLLNVNAPPYDGRHVCSDVIYLCSTDGTNFFKRDGITAVQLPARVEAGAYQADVVHSYQWLQGEASVAFNHDHEVFVKFAQLSPFVLDQIRAWDAGDWVNLGNVGVNDGTLQPLCSDPYGVMFMFRNSSRSMLRFWHPSGTVRMVTLPWRIRSLPDLPYLRSTGNLKGLARATSGSDVLMQVVKVEIVRPAQRAVTNTWTGGGANDHWSTAGNWDIGALADGADVVFTATDGATGPGFLPDPGIVNNLVDSSRTLNSLWYQPSNRWHVTEIPAGVSLSVTGALAGYAMHVGYAGSLNNANNYCFATLRGAGGLVVNNPAGVISVRIGIGSSGAARAAHLDLSGLDTFTADINQMLVGAEGSASTNRPGGVVYLARTNVIRGYSASPGLIIGDGAGDQGGGTNSVLNLGQTNVFLFNSGLTVGGRRNRAILRFTTPGDSVAYFRNLAGTGRQSLWALGDNNTGGNSAVSAGTNDFSAGTVDAWVDTVIVGRGQTGSTGNPNGSGTGALILGAGRLDANFLDIGFQRPGGSAAIGVVETSGGPGLTNLIVNGNVRLGHYDGLAAASATVGTLIIGSTVIIKEKIVSGGSALNVVNLNNGHLLAGAIGNDNGVNDAPLPTLNLESGTLTLDLGTASNPTTPVCQVTNLYVNSVTLNVAGAGLSAGVIPLIKVHGGGPTGNGFAGIVQGTLPPKVVGAFSNSTDTLYLVLTNRPQITGIARLPNGGLVMDGIGGPNTLYQVLAATNILLPMGDWTMIGMTETDAEGCFHFTDTTAESFAQRFYRLVIP